MKSRRDALARRLVAVMLAATTLIAVVAIIVLPGPALLVVPIGIATLVIEYGWARWWLRARGRED